MPTELTTPITPPLWTMQRISNWICLWMRDPDTGLIDPDLVSLEVQVETLNAWGETVRHDTHRLPWAALPPAIQTGLMELHTYLISRSHNEGWMEPGTDLPEW